jgi:hypothetical protein
MKKDSNQQDAAAKRRIVPAEPQEVRSVPSVSPMVKLKSQNIVNIASTVPPPPRTNAHEEENDTAARPSILDPRIVNEGNSWEDEEQPAQAHDDVSPRSPVNATSSILVQPTGRPGESTSRELPEATMVHEDDSLDEGRPIQLVDYSRPGAFRETFDTPSSEAAPARRQGRSNIDAFLGKFSGETASATEPSSSAPLDAPPRRQGRSNIDEFQGKFSGETASATVPSNFGSVGCPTKETGTIQHRRIPGQVFRRNCIRYGTFEFGSARCPDGTAAN